MPIVTPDKLATLQWNAEDVRNICILAHVDHGKTSLTDALIATNGIISPKLAGRIRYLDSRPDEQLRGITMESSAISLCFSMARRIAIEEQPVQKDYLINLIDSPGHVDFSSEVSTASRLCDGAVVLVDAVEGVCSQTVTVLRQSWIEHLKPILVINKIDRLVTELKMSPGEAYIHIGKLLEQVNAILGGFFQGERMEEDLQWRERVEEKVAASAAKEQEKLLQRESEAVNDSCADEITVSTNGEFEERDDVDLYFAPENNNVIFSSAIDGWAFTIRQFASFYEKKLGIKRSILEKVLWGDYYLDPRTKRVLSSKHLKGRALKPMFVQLVLDNIWAVYEATTGGSHGQGNPRMIEKITKSLSLTIPPHIFRSRDSRALLTTLFAAWIPLSTAFLISVVEQLPAPPGAQSSRLPAVIDASPGASHVDPVVRDAMVNFKTSTSDPIVAFVSKMFAVPASELPQNRRRGGLLTAEEARAVSRQKRAEIGKVQAILNKDIYNGLGSVTEALSDTNLGAQESTKLPEIEQTEVEQFVGFARLYSGTLTVGDSIYVLPPKFSPASPHTAPEPQRITISALYLLMGRGLEPLTSVPAGVVFGIGGLEGHILKSGTLCSQLEGSVNLAAASMGSEPIVRVALEPVNPSNLTKMINGMRMLEQSDPCAQYEVLESGEHVILTAGELHLERCLKDLRERFARCEIQAGKPIVPYRETITSISETVPPKSKEVSRGTVVAITASKQVSMRLRVHPLPNSVTEFLEKNSGAIKKLYAERKATDDLRGTNKLAEEIVDVDELADGNTRNLALVSLSDFKQELKEAFDEDKEYQGVWANVVDNITAFGPRRIGPNLLIDKTKSKICRRFLQETQDATMGEDHGLRDSLSTLSPETFSDNIAYAFQLATAQGPLCHEPTQGIAVLIEDIIVSPVSEEDDSTRDNLGRLTGEVIKAVRDSIQQGFLEWSPRLLLAMYSCEIQASTEVLGRVYAVLTRRHGRILSESLKEGTPFFTISALLPVASSFGFSDEMRKRTSGAASPQLRFRGFEMLDEDPFWVPSTEEELEDLGELADRENVAKGHMDRVRARKGLMIMGKKTIKDAEKQKTLKR